MRGQSLPSTLGDPLHNILQTVQVGQHRRLYLYVAHHQVECAELQIEIVVVGARCVSDLDGLVISSSDQQLAICREVDTPHCARMSFQH